MVPKILLRAGGVALFALLPVPSALAADVIFQAPLHLTRQIEDPISGKTVVLQEYAYGNRLVSVRGARTSIADYEKSELIEIDRDRGTYSVTRFDAIARALRIAAPGSGTVAMKSARPLRAAGARMATNGRTAEVFEAELESPAGQQRIEVAVDRTVLMSRTALEILSGAAYPSAKTAEHEIVLSAAAPSGPRNQTAERIYALPVEQIVRHQVDGEILEHRSTITRVASELPPADVVSIPAGAQLVESRVVSVAREIELLDNPSLAPPNPAP